MQHQQIDPGQRAGRELPRALECNAVAGGCDEIIEGPPLAAGAGPSLSLGKRRLDRAFRVAAPRPHAFGGRRVFFVSSRVHPGEVPAAHVLNGFLDFVLRADDPRARAMREAFVIKVVACLNPDGVFHGNYRCSLSGDDLNRQAATPQHTVPRQPRSRFKAADTAAQCASLTPYHTRSTPVRAISAAHFAALTPQRTSPR